MKKNYIYSKYHTRIWFVLPSISTHEKKDRKSPILFKIFCVENCWYIGFLGPKLVPLFIWFFAPFYYDLLLLSVKLLCCINMDPASKKKLYSRHPAVLYFDLWQGNHFIFLQNKIISIVLQYWTQYVVV